MILQNRTNPARKPVPVLIVSGLILGLLFGCTIEHQWRPDGSVEIVDHYTLDDLAAPRVVVNYRISNGDGSHATILVSTLVIEIDTEEHIYYETIIDTSRIPSGHSVYGRFECLFRDEIEEVAEVRVSDSFFE